MKDDTISRAAAIDAIDVIPWYHQNKHGEMVHGANSDEHQAWYKADDVYTAIESVPSAQPGWIPCNRELPKESGDYLVTIKYGEKQYAVDCLEYNAYGKEWNDGELFGWIVTAWQPAPKPWEGGQDG